MVGKRRTALAVVCHSFSLPNDFSSLSARYYEHKERGAIMIWYSL